MSGGTLGTQLFKPFKVFSHFLRANETRVLNGSRLNQRSYPTAAGGPAAAGAAVQTFGPSDFALQMVKSPEAIRFTTQTNNQS